MSMPRNTPAALRMVPAEQARGQQRRADKALAELETMRHTLVKERRKVADLERQLGEARGDIQMLEARLAQWVAAERTP